ncbi:methylamine utilization protein [Sphingomonas glacialis]|uniref:Methylamine utilization protein n=1 Tax=Sphingomonas glacialis TaxID=658225 RepID=A0ABQ3LUM9_9SPHN|nr:methylamine utilization protein [Sphingomonas glacialis]GHH26593.1 methylamine utilization protein [Sphingomonas glacialis]
MRMFLTAFTTAAASFLASVASAATVNIDVRGSDGKPLAGAVVMLDTSPKSSAPIKFDYAYEMAQQNIAFLPHVLIIPVGASVTFPNRDKVRHHVYSFSKAKKFDLKLYGKDETRAVVFDKVGVVALGCNIHDAMSGFVIAVDTPFAVQTDANGHATITGVPIGGVSVRVWHPMIHAADNVLTQPATVSAAGLATTYTIRGK